MLKLWNASNAQVQKWYRKSLDGCVSSNGKEYSISLKRGTVNKLLVNFVGGGASWNDYTASRPITIGSTLLKKETYYVSDIAPILLSFMHVGILGMNDKRNPFYDWYVLNIPYTTADFHIGNNEYTYVDDKGKERVLYHHGMKNVNSALKVLKELLPQTPDTLFIMGLSAGGFGCVANSPAIYNLYPECKNIIVYSEGSHMYYPLWTEVLNNIWNVNTELIAYAQSNDFIIDLFQYAQDHMPPNTLFLHSNSVWDGELTGFMSKMNHDKFEVNSQTLQEFHDTLINATRKAVSSIKNYSYYLTDFGRSFRNGVTPHTFCGNPKLLYGKLQNDISIASWLRLAIEKYPLSVGENFVL